MKHPDCRAGSGHADGAGLVPLSPQAGKAVSFGGEARQLFCDRTQIGVDVSGHTGHIEDIEKPNRSDEDDKS